MKIVLLGGSGRLGWELQRALAPLGEVAAPVRASLDLLRTDDARAQLRTLRPDVIVNAAAYTDVDRAESETSLARALNADAPALLAHAARELGARLVHFSTDQVLADVGDAPHAEDAPTGPLNTYAATKLDGERHVQASGCRHLILRVAWLHASHGKEDFVRLIARLAREQPAVQVVNDQFGAPTPAALVADVTAHLVRADAQGLYHVACSGETSRHALAVEIVGWLRAQSIPLAVTDVQAVSSAQRAAPARRPRNARLDTRRLCGEHGLVMPPWRAGVERTLAEVYRR